MENAMKSEQSVEILIDYITITKPGLELHGEREIGMLLHDYDGREKYESTSAPRGYRFAVRNDIGAIGASGRKEQGTLLSWSGSALKQTNALTIGELAISNDWRVTRLDCTVDFLGYETLVSDYQQELEHGQANTQAREPREIKDPKGGHTLYIGSWHSERFMRIYNKTASEARFTDVSTLPERWVRCELVLRENHAASAIRFILRSGTERAIPAILRGYCDFPNIEEYAGMAGETITTKGKGKTDSNRQKWLINQVLPTLVEELKRDDKFQNEFMGLLMKHLGFG